jgi:hypothetical protein
MTVDPFAAQSVQTGPAVSTEATSPAPDAFSAAADMDDPFATKDDYRGDFKPSPNMEALEGRLVVMIPRAYDPAAKDPNNPGDTRELYTVDLTVLTGGSLKFFYTEKGDPERGTQDKLTEYDAGNITPDAPATWDGYWVPQKTLLGKLKASHRDGRPYLGVVTMIPVKADRDKGVTNAQVREAFAQWEATGRRSNRPRYTWSMEAPDAATRAHAVAWWKNNRDRIAPINTATAPAK